LALASPYLASVSSLLLIRGKEGRKVDQWSWGNKKRENKSRIVIKIEAEIETEIVHD